MRGSREGEGRRGRGEGRGGEERGRDRVERGGGREWERGGEEREGQGMGGEREGTIKKCQATQVRVPFQKFPYFIFHGRWHHSELRLACLSTY